MVIPSFPTINNPKVQSALAEAAEQEPGTPLNDHYSPDFYVERRADFLGKRHDYQHIKNGMFSIANEHADIVFGDYKDDLSVQEVRRREIINEIVPFLPLPTTCNTETIDSFAGLPDSEWEEGKEGVYPVLSPTPSPPPGPTKIGAIGANNDGVSLAQGLNETPLSDRQSAMASSQRGDAAQQAPDVERPELLPGILNQLDRLYPMSNTGAAGLTANLVANPPAINDLEIGQAGPAAVAAGSQGARLAGAGAWRRPAPAYANSPTSAPVKRRRGTKRARAGPEGAYQEVSSDSEAGEDSAASGDEAVLPARKKLKLNPGPKPPKTKRQAPPAAASDASSEVIEVAPQESAAPKRKTAASTKPSGPSIDAIVAGTALPRSRMQAQEANVARRNLLIAKHNATLRRRKKKTNNHPDIMPEYFSPANFPADEVDQTVRCVCGLTYDDGTEMLCCDGEGCNVWQHLRCMGAAAPKDLETGSYRCHNCDPWAHRRLILGLRKATVVEME